MLDTALGDDALGLVLDLDGDPLDFDDAAVTTETVGGVAVTRYFWAGSSQGWSDGDRVAVKLTKEGSLAAAMQLVGNLDQVEAGYPSLGEYDQAQAFTTGAAGGGYTLTSVEIVLYSATDTAFPGTVAIWTEDAGRPDSSMGTLANPAALDAAGECRILPCPEAVYEFASSSGIALDANATYFVVIDADSSGDSQVNVVNTGSTREDPGGAAHWSIGDLSLYRSRSSDGAWTSFIDSKRIRINGVAHETAETGGVPVVTIEAVSAEVEFGAANWARFRLRRTEAVDEPLRTVCLSVTHQPALNKDPLPCDFGFGSGERAVTFFHMVVDEDDNGEPICEVAFEVLSGTGYAVGSPSEATVAVKGPGTICTTGNQRIAEPLTAGFEDLPNSHDGATAFDFRIAFSEDIAAGETDMRDHALTVDGGSVTGAVRVDGRDDLWSFTVTPSGPDNVSILLDGGRACDEAGAICTEDGRTLGNGLALLLAYVAPRGDGDGEAALTASFEDVPETHDGDNAFTFGLRFSEEVAVGFRTLRDEAFEVTGGAVDKAKRREAGSNLAWTITVEPAGRGAVTVELPATTDCGASGAVCTADGRGLSNAPSATVAGPSAQAVVDGGTLTLTWGAASDGFAPPDGSDFAVRVKGALRPVAAASLRAHGTVLTLAVPVLAGEAVALDYLGSAMHPLGGAVGDPLRAWRDLPVANVTDTDEADLWAAAAGAERPPAAGPRSLSLAGLGLADADLAALPLPADLRRLDLSGNALTDLSALAGLRELRSLDLSGNAVADPAPLRGLTELRRLDLSGNRIADLWPLADLPALEVLLLDGNRVSDLGPLTHFGRLENLGLSGNLVGDLRPLGDLWSLRRLDLGGNPARDLSPVGDLETLVWLRLPIAGDDAPAHRLVRLRWLLAPGAAGECLGCPDSGLLETRRGR